MANRYSEGAVAQFNPMSMAEIARYPEMLRQKEDAAMASLGALSGDIKNYNALEADLLEADKLTSSLDQEIGDLSKDLTKNGYNQSAYTKLIDLKRRKDQLFSEQGLVGRAQRSFGEFEKYKSQLDALALSGKISEPHRQALIQNSLSNFTGSTSSVFSGMGAAVNPGITQSIQKIAKEVGSNQTEAFRQAGITRVGVDPSTGQEIWETKSGQRINTRQGAINEAVKYLLSNDPNSRAYMEQLEELGLAEEVNDQITRLSSGAESYLGINRGSTETTLEEKFAKPTTTTSKSGSGKSSSQDTTIDPVQYATTKDAVDFEGGRITEEAYNQLPPEKQNEYDQKVYLENAFEKNNQEVLKTLNAELASDIRKWENNIVSNRWAHNKSIEIIERLSSSFGENGNFQVWEEDGLTTVTNKDFKIKGDKVFDVSTGEELKVLRKDVNSLRDHLLDYNKNYQEEKESYVDAGLIVPSSMIGGAATSILKDVNNYLTPTTINVEGASVYDLGNNETSELKDDEELLEALENAKIYGFDENSNVKMVASGSGGDMVLEWEYTDNSESNNPRIKTLRLPIKDTGISQNLIKTIGGKETNIDPFLTRAKLSNYSPGFGKAKPFTQEQLDIIQPGASEKFSNVGLSYAPLGKNQSTPEVNMFFGDEPLTIDYMQQILLQTKQELIDNGEDASSIQTEINKINTLKNNRGGNNAYPFTNMVEAVTMLQEFIKTDISNEAGQ